MEGAFASLTAGVHFDPRRLKHAKSAFHGRSVQPGEDAAEPDPSGGSGGPAAPVSAQNDTSGTRDPFEAANALRRAFRIRATGGDIPPPLVTFNDLQSFGASKRLGRNLRACGATDIAEPTPVQRQAIPCLMAGRDTIAIAPTGSGKTLAFLVPVALVVRAAAKRGEAGIHAVVLAPTRELAGQTAATAGRLGAGLGLRCAMLAGAGAIAGTDFSKVDVLLGTPQRVAKAVVAGRCDLSTVRVLVCDEADKLLGAEELKPLDVVLAACRHPQRVVGLFSATLPEGAEALARGLLPAPARITIGERGAAARAVRQRLVFVGREAGKPLALRQLLAGSAQPPMLAFVRSAERASAIHSELAAEGVAGVDSIGGGAGAAARAAAMAAFRAGRTALLLTTDLLARGIDFVDVATVVNYDFPDSAVTYVHRVGRTGRAGRPGAAVTFFTEADAGQLRRIANVMVAAGCEVPKWMLQLQKEPTREKDRLKRRRKKDQVQANPVASIAAEQPGSSKRRKAKRGVPDSEAPAKGVIQNPGHNSSIVA